MKLRALRVLSLLLIVGAIGWLELRPLPATAQSEEEARQILRQTIEKFSKVEQMSFTVFASEERIFKDGVPLNFVFEYTVSILGLETSKLISRARTVLVKSSLMTVSLLILTRHEISTRKEISRAPPLNSLRCCAMNFNSPCPESIW